MKKKTVINKRSQSQFNLQIHVYIISYLDEINIIFTLANQK